MEFRYRASETLLQAIEVDALSHIIAMRWFCEYFADRFGGPAPLYGAYPGLELFDRDSSAPLGAVDVALLFRDGTLALGECKRTGAGLQSDDLTKLDRLVDRVAGPWSFIATPDWADGCSDLWQQAVRYAPDPSPRVALTGEQLLSGGVFHALGTDPFAWTASTREEQEAKHRNFVANLSESLDWLEGRTSPDDWMAR